MKTLRHAWQPIPLAAALVAAALFAGCNDGPVSTVAPDPQPLSQVVKGGSDVQVNSDGLQLVTYDPNSPSTTQATSAAIIKAASGGKLQTDHFTLSIPGGALTSNTFISIEEVSGSAMECRAEPTGLVFLKPASLIFKYQGTSADPSSPTYSAGILTGAWLDPSSSLWVPIGGSDDTRRLQYTSLLSHLSYYALAK